MTTMMTHEEGMAFYMEESTKYKELWIEACVEAAGLRKEHEKLAWGLHLKDEENARLREEHEKLAQVVSVALKDEEDVEEGCAIWVAQKAVEEKEQWVARVHGLVAVVKKLEEDGDKLRDLLNQVDVKG